MTLSRPARVARGALAAGTATFTALLSHLAGGGVIPGWLGIAVPLLLATMVCTLLTGRRVSIVRLGIGVGVSQVLFHFLFVLGTIAPSGQAVVAHHAGTPLMPPASEPMHEHLAPTMWVGHAVAAVVTTLALWSGERLAAVLRMLAGRVVAWLRRLVHELITSVRAPRRAVRAVGRPSHAPLSRHASSLSRRGPPFPAAAF
jgi:hypothetical protein